MWLQPADAPREPPAWKVRRMTVLGTRACMTPPSVTVIEMNWRPSRLGTAPLGGSSTGFVGGAGVAGGGVAGGGVPVGGAPATPVLHARRENERPRRNEA